MKNEKTVDIVFVGVGGQGVLTAAEICSQVAMAEGYFVKRSDIRGLSQRGGAVESQLRIGRKIHSPIILPNSADFIVVLEPSLIDSVRERFFGNDTKDLSDYAQNGVFDKTQMRSLNIYMLGVLSRFLPFSTSSWKVEIERILGRRSGESNLYFQKGSEISL